jgi:hypothetical protein
MVRSVTDVELQDGVHAIGPDEGVRLLDVWEAAVRATHDFLSESDIQFFKPLVLPGLLTLERLSCVRSNSTLERAPPICALSHIRLHVTCRQLVCPLPGRFSSR